jgi:formylglycine-generating enzyme required for sulfatase activity
MARFGRQFLVYFMLCAALAFPAQAAERLALVIGNDIYKNLPQAQQLKKARNDAQSVAQTLEGLGFKVTLDLDVTRFGFNKMVDKFARQIERGDTVTVFFAGHGVRINGRNYLLPSDVPNMTGSSQELLAGESIAVDTITDRIQSAGARIAMLILDACRNNPFQDAKGRSVGGSRGLARMEPPEGTFVLFSAGANQEAFDRLSDADQNPNSVFTRTLLPLLRQEGLEVARMARLLRQRVKKLALSVNHKQTPAAYNEVTGDFYIVPAKSGGTVRPAPQPRPQPAPAPAPPVSEAARAWDAVRNSSNIDLLKAFAERFKTSFFATLARERIAELEKAQPSAPPVKPNKDKVAIGVFPKKILQGDEAPIDKAPPEPVRGPGDRFKDCPQCPELVVLPAGSFTIGSPSGERGRERDEGPRRAVTIAKPFAVGRYEVTLGQFRQFVRASGHMAGKSCHIHDGSWRKRRGFNFDRVNFSQGENHPATCISWNDAKAYVGWLSRKTGNTYRLLSEAEWEYAARAGTTTPYATGHSLSSRQARFAAGRPARVGSYSANGFGLYDMHGNMWEWVEDCYRASYRNLPGDGSAYTGGSCEKRVLRSGGWNSRQSYLRSASRDKFFADGRYTNGGFRVAREL